MVQQLETELKDIPMSDMLARLRAASSKAAAASPATETQATQAAPAPAVQTPAAAVSQPVAEAKVEVAAQPANTALSTATSPQTPPGNALPSLITSDAEAAELMTSLMSPSANSSTGLADVADTVEGGGMKLSHPFAQIKKGHWNVHKNVPDALKEYMPVGGVGHKFHAVYLGHRLAANIWQGEVGDGGSPVASFAIPHVKVAAKLKEKVGIDVTVEDLSELTRQTLLVANKIQYTKSDQRNTLFPKGRLAPEIHILVWTPNTGYVILVAPGYSTVMDTLENLRGDVETKFQLVPLAFEIKEHETINRHAKPGDKNYKWVHHSVTASLQPADKRAQNVAEGWAAYKSANVREIANQLFVFYSGEDFSGLGISQIAEKLHEFKGYIDALPARGKRGSSATE